MRSEEKSICFKVIVVSDRVADGLLTDASGELAVKMLSDRGACVGEKVVVRNSYLELMKVLRNSWERVLLFLGGTGPSPRDVTVDVVENAAWRCLPGFGELYRYISYQKIGVSAILTRTTLCVLHDGKIAAVLPGSPDAVTLGTELLSQIIDHLVEEVDRFEAPHRDAFKGR